MRDTIKLPVVLHGVYSFTIDNCSQILNQVSILKNNSYSSSLLRSTKSSVILMSFNMLEGYANFLASLAIGLSNRDILGPEVKVELNIIEQDILKEESSKYDFKKCSVESRKNNYVATMDKIKTVLTLLSKIYGKEYKLETGENEWNQIKALKKERDKLTHPKFDINMLPSIDSNKYLDDITNVNPTFNIDDKVLIEGIIGLRWYFHKSALLLQELFREDMSKNLLTMLDVLLYKLILDLNNILKVFESNSEFINKKVVNFRNYETDYYDNVQLTALFLTQEIPNDNLEPPKFE